MRLAGPMRTPSLTARSRARRRLLLLPMPLLAAAAATILALLAFPAGVGAQGGIGMDDEAYAEAFGRPGYNALSVHQPAQGGQKQGQQQSPFAQAMPKGPVKKNPAFIPLNGEAGLDASEVPLQNDRTPTIYQVKMEKGKQLRCVLEGEREVLGVVCVGGVGGG